VVTKTQHNRIPRDSDDDYTHEAADERRRFLQDQSGGDFEHVTSYSFDPSILPGNIEGFVGVA
jgi:hydroxymethylglutaryl-CoA reductase (NADPH)